MEQQNQQNQQQAVAVRSLALDNAIELHSETVFRLAISEARLGQALRELERLTAENAKLSEELTAENAKLSEELAKIVGEHPRPQGRDHVHGLSEYEAKGLAFPDSDA